jgi:type II secretory pathway pseudopilin PulG
MKRNMPRRSRGATLVEALVAMAVMAFGMLAIVGVQQTLRVNSDLSKQRNEATRLAEREIETVRMDASSGEAQFDAIPIGTTPSTVAGDNATFTVARTVSQAPDNATADNRSLMTYVVVTWRDRTGEERRVVMHDMLARVDPMLSGLVRAEKPLTPVGRRSSRHPTIPGRAHDLGDGKSIFKPVESNSTVAWVFNNSTGVITHFCTVSSSLTSASLNSISGCTETAAQLLAGEIRFNLRGGTRDLGSESVIKPVASGEVAWVINNASKSVTRLCPVPAATPTASLTSSMVSSGCTAVAPSIAIAPFEPADSTYTLLASDSEDPEWLSIPATVDLDGSVPTEGVLSMNCYSNAEMASSAPTIATTVQRSIEYFCIVRPYQIEDGWGARTKVVPLPFSNGGAIWATGNVAGSYRVCRYTTASSGYTTNLDHPNIYGKESSSCGSTCQKVKGNLINQNFLIIDGMKACPSDVAPDPAAGNLVNSNTLQHQP